MKYFVFILTFIFISCSSTSLNRDSMGQRNPAAKSKLKMKEKKACNALLAKLVRILAGKKIKEEIVFFDGMLDDFYLNEKPFYISTKNGKRALTYSYDSEIGHLDLLEHIFHDDTLSRNLSIAFSQLKKEGEYFNILPSSKKPYEMTRNEIKSYFSVTEKQMQKGAVFIKGTDQTKKYYDMTDLKKTYVAELIYWILNEYMTDLETRILAKPPWDFRYTNTSVEKFFQQYEHISKQLMQKLQIESKVTRDQSFIEIVHPSFTQIPSKEADLIYLINDEFFYSATHLHFGIPSIIGKPKVLAIARAVETIQTILRQMSEDFPARVYRTDFTTLGDSIDDFSAKGNLKLAFDRFVGPTGEPMADIEVRQYQSIKQGLNLVAFGAKLAKKHKKLRILGITFGPKVHDPLTGNLEGALFYLGNMIKAHGSDQDIIVGKKMLKLAATIKKEGEISGEMRKIVRRFLFTIDINQYLKLEYFLK